MLSFKKANPEDGQALYRIARAAFEEDRQKYGCTPEVYEAPEVLLKYIQQRCVYKMIKDEKIIGGMCCFNQGQGHFWLGAIFIDPSYQNQGIGKKAISFLEASHPEAKTWGLDTPYASYRNHHFYESLGFKKVRETEPEKNGFYLFVYKKEI